MTNQAEFQAELAAVCNKYGIDSVTNTPDFILGELLTEFLFLHAAAMNQTIKWHGWPTLDEKLRSKVEIPDDVTKSS